MRFGAQPINEYGRRYNLNGKVTCMSLRPLLQGVWWGPPFSFCLIDCCGGTAKACDLDFIEAENHLTKLEKQNMNLHLNSVSIMVVLFILQLPSGLMAE